ncbi:hypothetical protein F4677DRAFT_75467 [Hypoxylon crocopeplum]|nr:hypothetical protein F4677DRAFT_75467 [Hypoxylon crocopeplum]
MPYRRSSVPVVIIATQADIDKVTLSSYSLDDDDEAPAVLIRNATGTLNFTTLARAFRIEVSTSPQLEVLDFPLLESLLDLSVYKAQSLSSISMPRLTNRDPVVELPGVTGAQAFHLNITGSPSLSELNLPELTNIDHLTLFDIGDSLPNFLNMANIISAGNVSVTNNTSCTIDFDHLTEVGNLFITDNSNTTLPIFPALARVENIHLRGYMNTSLGSNIFPALDLASGTVTVEPWGNFDCSKLISQQRNGIIHNLICNGTDNGTNNGTVNGTGNGMGNGTGNGAGNGTGNGTSNGTDNDTNSPSAGLSQGAWAGIGVSIGVVVIGGIVTAVWFAVRWRRLYKDLSERLTHPQEDHDASEEETQQCLIVEGLHEVEGQGILREKPDDHIRELPSMTPELPGDSTFAVGSYEATNGPRGPISDHEPE